MTCMDFFTLQKNDVISVADPAAGCGEGVET